MKAYVLSAAILLALGGCVAGTPPTTWAKPGVSRVDYGTDVGMCTGQAVMLKPGNGANTAGGIDGQPIAHAANVPLQAMGQPANPGTSAQTTHTEAALPAAGSYSGMASSDFAQRAATQQRSQEMAAMRARSEALKSCLTGRGYQEVALTDQQAAHLRTLEKGSNEYHEYLYAIGSEPRK